MNFRGYRDTLTFQDQSATPSGSGERTNWVDVLQQRGSITPLRGRELIAAQSTFGAVSVRIRTRYNAAIHSRMRVVSGGTTYTVQHVIDMGNMHRELELMTDAGARNG